MAGDVSQSITAGPRIDDLYSRSVMNCLSVKLV